MALTVKIDLQYVLWQLDRPQGTPCGWQHVKIQLLTSFTTQKLVSWCFKSCQPQRITSGPPRRMSSPLRRYMLNYVRVMIYALSPNIIPSGWLGSKHQLILYAPRIMHLPLWCYIMCYRMCRLRNTHHVSCFYDDDVTMYLISYSGYIIFTTSHVFNIIANYCDILCACYIHHVCYFNQYDLLLFSGTHRLISFCLKINKS